LGNIFLKTLRSIIHGNYSVKKAAEMLNDLENDAKKAEYK
jgi:class I fructose-bisphosphate aldolase/fructose-bisphosphate aldolase/2-amino-3,7-dideoxy-D-threo-hept-6-ulosonate synthase